MGEVKMVPEEKLQWKVKEEKLGLFPLLLWTLLSTLIMIGVLYGGYYHCDWIPVPKSDDKLPYYVRSCVFPCAVVLFWAIISVGKKRRWAGATNPLAGREHLVQVENNFLTNTVEQMLLHLLITLALTTYLDAAEMKIVPLSTFLWVIGRVLFRIGYPHYRACGIQINFSSAAFFILLVAYRMYMQGFMYRISSQTLGLGAIDETSVGTCPL